MTMRTPARSSLCVLLAVLTIAVGVTLRMVPIGLPQFLLKYGGSVLWAVMVYWIVAAIRRKKKPEYVAVLAGGTAVIVECIKLVHSAKLDHFRLTTAGKLLLGRYFSIADIVAYGIAIAAMAWIDKRMLQRHQ